MRIPPTRYKTMLRLLRLIVLPILLIFAAWALIQNWIHCTWVGNWCGTRVGSDGGPITDYFKGGEFSWNRVTPTESLVYHSCYDGLRCARLDVPMDWNRTDKKHLRVAIAIVRLPAKVPVTDPRYGGAILINPGGPGGSGVSLLLDIGKDLQTIVDSELAPSSNVVTASANVPKYFDIIGFDPRGINNTTPRLSCFPDEKSRYIWNLQSEVSGVFGSSDDSFTSLWARSNSLAEGCSRMAATDNGDEGLGQFLNTSPVVADMVEIIERHGEWREKQAAGWSSSPAIIQSTKWRKGEEKLLFWGFSYGTILGASLAAMQPHRIGRAVLDGVCNAPDYYRGSWLTNIQDADLILDKFSEYCFQAGVEQCALYTGETPQDIKNLFQGTLKSLKMNPIGVPAFKTRAPNVITYSDAQTLIMNAVYSPLKKFTQLAEIFADISQGNGSSFADYKQQQFHGSKLYDNNEDDMATAILCTDGESMEGLTLEAYKEYWRVLREQSDLLGDAWASVRLRCVGWNGRPKWRFNGPFTSKTSHPILWLGNTVDPVTPIRNAHYMAKGFSGSVVLQQDSEGHCSVSSPSLCTAKKVRNYFQTGDLPKPGTVCDVEERPFIGLKKPENDLSLSDRVLKDALVRISRNF